MGARPGGSAHWEVSSSPPMEVTCKFLRAVQGGPTGPSLLLGVPFQKGEAGVQGPLQRPLGWLGLGEGGDLN